MNSSIKMTHSTHFFNKKGINILNIFSKKYIEISFQFPREPSDCSLNGAFYVLFPVGNIQNHFHCFNSLFKLPLCSKYKFVTYVFVLSIWLQHLKGIISGTSAGPYFSLCNGPPCTLSSSFHDPLTTYSERTPKPTGSLEWGGLLSI